ncbi:MAG: 1-acyl-sn-glycerol-3-phosphate acyltransferase [Neomegalonema sp.]|nr:1-acyl-sn-glycerol-3-phosphate acyltransferase [Neomegalonema sp.]
MGLRDIVSFVRTRVFELYVLVMSLFVGAAIVLYPPFGWYKHPPSVRWLLRLWSTLFVHGARVILGVTFRIEGWENTPDEPVIFIGNHQSYWESIMMTVLVPHINVVTKRASMNVPVFGWGLKNAPMIAVDRGEPGRNIRKILRGGKKTLREGRSILIFPEGRRIFLDEPEQPFLRGFELLYRDANAPVIPFVNNAGLYWPRGFEIKYPGTIVMRFFPPIAPGLAPDQFAEHIESFIRAEQAKLMAQSTQGGAGIVAEPLRQAAPGSVDAKAGQTPQ